MIIIKKFLVHQGIFKCLILLVLIFSCSKIKYKQVDNAKFNLLSKLVTDIYKKGDTLIFKNKNSIKKFVIDKIEIDEYKAGEKVTLLRRSSYKSLYFYLKDINREPSLSYPFIEVVGSPKDIDEEIYCIYVSIGDFNEKLIDYETIDKLKRKDTLRIKYIRNNVLYTNEESIKKECELLWNDKKGIISFKLNGDNYNLVDK